MINIKYEDIPIVEDDNTPSEEDHINEELEIASNKMRIPSKEQWDKEKPKFPLLPRDDYELTIAMVEAKNQPRYMPKPGQSATEDVYNITLQVVSLKDGSEAKDVDGESANGRKVFFTARPESMGFRQSGEPSISRCFLASALKQNDNDELEFDTWEALIGKNVWAEIIQKKNTKGVDVNKINRFLPAPRAKK